MKNGYTRDSLRRLASLLLAVVIAVTFMPFLGETAYAEDMDGKAAVSEQSVQSVSGEEADTVITDEELADMEKQIEESLEVGDEGSDEEDADKAEAVDPDLVASSDNSVTKQVNGEEAELLSQQLGGGKLHADSVSTEAVPAGTYTLKITPSGNSVIINGAINKSEYTFRGIFVDVTLEENITASSFSNKKVDLSSYGTGYHTVAIGISKKSDPDSLVDLVLQKYVPVNTITVRPTYAGRLSVYSTYLNIYPYNMYFANEDGPLYMELSSDGGKSWGKRYKLLAANLIELKIQQGSMVGGLSPNTKYLTRLRYGDYFKYSSDDGGDDQSYLFLGPALYTGTIKTGKAKKPKVKSVTCKAVKVKYHKIRWPGYWNVVGGVAFWHKPYTERYYTYKIKVTIKLKKKPGTKGIWVSCSDSSGEKFLKGNKKKYTTTFKPLINYSAKKPKGHVKVKVYVRSGQSKTYGGYSPYYTSKKKKLK